MRSLQTLYRLRLAEDGIAAGDVTPMMVFPVGEWHSAKYPNLPLTEELANELIANFEAGVLGTEPVVDSSGKHDTSAPAAGWVKRVYLASYEEGEVTGLALWADVKWTKLGAELLADEQYKYGSVEIGSVVLNDTGETVDNVLRSLTLTNTPVLRLMPGVQNAAAKQRDVVTLSLSEFSLSDEDDPAAEVMAKFDEALAFANEKLGGKSGIKDLRAFVRAAVAKASAHKLAEPDSVNARRDELERACQERFGAGGEGVYVEDFGDDWCIYHVWRDGEGAFWRAPYVADEHSITLGQPVEVKRETTYVPVSDGAPGAGTPSGSQPVAMGEGGEGTGAAASEDHAAEKGAEHRMNSKALSILKLAEDAGEDAQSAAVIALAEERDGLQAQLADRDKADKQRAFEAKLSEALAEDEKGCVHMLPGEKDAYVKLAELDHEAAMAAVQARIDGPAALKLGAEGSGSEGDADEAKPADVELAETAKARAAKDGIKYAEAEKLVLAENPELAERYQAQRFNTGKEA